MYGLFKQDRRRFKVDIDRARPWFKTRDGVKLGVRLLQPDDKERLIEFFDHLSPQTRWRRFHTNVEHVSRDLINQRAADMANVDNRIFIGAVVATLEDASHEQIVGVVRLARPAAEPDAPEAEVAIVVRDDFHGRGVGRELLRWVVLLARRMRVKTILAVFQPDNDSAIRLFRELDLPTKITAEHGETIMHIQVPSDE